MSACFSEQQLSLRRMRSDSWELRRTMGVSASDRVACECPCAFKTALNLSFLFSTCFRLGEVCSADQGTDKQQGCPAAAGSQRAKRRERPQALAPGRGKGKGSTDLTPHFCGGHWLRKWYRASMLVCRDIQDLVLAGLHTTMCDFG